MTQNLQDNIEQLDQDIAISKAVRDAIKRLRADIKASDNTRIRNSSNNWSIPLEVSIDVARDLPEGLKEDTVSEQWGRVRIKAGKFGEDEVEITSSFQEWGPSRTLEGVRDGDELFRNVKEVMQEAWGYKVGILAAEARGDDDE